MIKQFGDRFAEYESYDRQYRLKPLYWPESYGNGSVGRVTSFDTVIEEKAELVVYPSTRDIKHHNNRRMRR